MLSNEKNFNFKNSDEISTKLESKTNYQTEYIKVLENFKPEKIEITDSGNFTYIQNIDEIDYIFYFDWDSVKNERLVVSFDVAGNDRSKLSHWFLTNKGLFTASKIFYAILAGLKYIYDQKRFKEIEITASNTGMSLEESRQLEDKFKDLLASNSEVLDGLEIFYYTEDNFQVKFVKDEAIFLEDNEVTAKKPVQDFFLHDENEEFVTANSYELPFVLEFLADKGILLQKKSPEKSWEQRMMMYKRAIKKIFPEAEIKEENGSLVIVSPLDFDFDTLPIFKQLVENKKKVA